MDLGLTGKTVFITGASGGIGRALAEAFAASGARLALQGHRTFDELRAWLGDQEFADRSLALRADVTQADGIDEAMREAQERFGRIDVCVANAGIWPPESLPLHVSPEVRVREVIEVNLLGAMWTARSFLASLARTGPCPDQSGASLVFTGSTAGRFGEAGHGEYAAAKAGLVGLVRSLKNEIVSLDPFGRVNMVQPGWTVTHMTRKELEVPGAIARVVRTMPLRQLGRAKDIARTVLFLASPAAARHISGEILTVAGGMEGRVQWTPDEIDEAAVRERTFSD